MILMEANYGSLDQTIGDAWFPLNEQELPCNQTVTKSFFFNGVGFFCPWGRCSCLFMCLYTYISSSFSYAYMPTYFCISEIRSGAWIQGWGRVRWFFFLTLNEIILLLVHLEVDFHIHVLPFGKRFFSTKYAFYNAICLFTKNLHCTILHEWDRMIFVVLRSRPAY